MTGDVAALYAAWWAATMLPVGFMLGSPCSPCCGDPECAIDDGKSRTDPASEGVWAPSGTWRGVGGVTWAFSSTPSTTDGGTWFFYGSSSTSKLGGSATTAEQRDWGNICNWYSNKTTTPSDTSNLFSHLNRRATRLPPTNAVVHVFTNVNTSNTGPVTIKTIYFWGSAQLIDGSELTTTDSAHDSVGGAILNNTSKNTSSTINNGATFNNSAQNSAGTVNDGAVFNNFAENNSLGTVNGGATFNDSARNNRATVNNGGTFNNSSRNTDNSDAIVNNGATFNDNAQNIGVSFIDPFLGLVVTSSPVVNGGAVFNNSSRNTSAIVNGGATFNDNSDNRDLSIVNSGATFNDNATNLLATVNGGAIFNDAACSTRQVGSFFASPCTRKFVAHPTDLPTCNGTAPNGCVNSADTCGCG
jgi:hypothetical protein